MPLLLTVAHFNYYLPLVPAFTRALGAGGQESLWRGGLGRLASREAFSKLRVLRAVSRSG